MVLLILDMISKKTFVTWDGRNLSSNEYKIEEGLQQGTINSSILFNLYLSDLPRIFNFNKPGSPAILTFADDIVVYMSGNRAKAIYYTTSEKARCLERKCLRTCLGLYRSQSSDWQHFVSNKTLYDKSEIPRVDLFVLRLTRDYLKGSYTFLGAKMWSMFGSNSGINY